MAVAGLEKFSHLEDKIYRTVELCKTLKQEREELEREVAVLRRDLSAILAEKDRLERDAERAMQLVRADALLLEAIRCTA